MPQLVSRDLVEPVEVMVLLLQMQLQVQEQYSKQPSMLPPLRHGPVVLLGAQHRAGLPQDPQQQLLHRGQRSSP